MSAPPNPKNLTGNPRADDIPNAFPDYLTSANTKPRRHQEEAIPGLFAGVREDLKASARTISRNRALV